MHMSLRHLIPVIPDDTPRVTLPIVHSSLETRAAPAAPLPSLFVAPDASNATVPEMIPANSKRNRAFLACLSCNKAKKRCEPSSAGGSCVRCAKLKVQCVFPELTSSAAAAVPRNGGSVSQGAHSEDIDDEDIHIPSRKRLEISSKVEDIAEYKPFRCYIYDVLLKRLKSDFIPNLPVELLREMVSIGTRNQDLALIGSTLSIAAACGFSMGDLLGGESNSPGNLMSLFKSAIQGDSSKGNGLTAPVEDPYCMCLVASAPLETELLPDAISACTSWAHDDLTSMGFGPAKIMAKRLSNTGDMKLLYNQVFQDELASCEEMLELMKSKRMPNFIHPEDLPKIDVKGELWTTLSPPVQVDGDTTTTRRTSFYQSPSPVRFKKSTTIYSASDFFTSSHFSAQLVVLSNQNGQESFYLFAFRDLLKQPDDTANMADDSFKEDVLATAEETLSAVSDDKVLEEGGLTSIFGENESDGDTMFLPVESSHLLDGTTPDTAAVTEFWSIIESFSADEVLLCEI